MPPTPATPRAPNARTTAGNGSALPWLVGFGNNRLISELPIFSVLERWANIRHLARLPEDAQRVHVAVLYVLSRAPGIKFEWVAKRRGWLDFKHGCTGPGRRTSQI